MNSILRSAKQFPLDYWRSDCGNLRRVPSGIAGLPRKGNTSAVPVTAFQGRVVDIAFFLG
jgi:hypothetical protein